MNHAVIANNLPQNKWLKAKKTSSVPLLHGK